MAIGKEIKTKITSIQGTQKITRAMEMVAASKMRKTQDRMNQSRPYADKMRHVIHHLAGSHPEYNHLYMEKRQVKGVGFIVISSDRGLCGGLNINLFKAVLGSIKNWKEQGADVYFCAIGSKSANFFKNYGGDLMAAVTHLGDKPEIAKLIGSVQVMLDGFSMNFVTLALKKLIDSIFGISNSSFKPM